MGNLCGRNIPNIPQSFLLLGSIRSIFRTSAAENRLAHHPIIPDRGWIRCWSLRVSRDIGRAETYRNVTYVEIISVWDRCLCMINLINLILEKKTRTIFSIFSQWLIHDDWEIIMYYRVTHFGGRLHKGPRWSMFLLWYFGRDSAANHFPWMIISSSLW